VTKGVPDPMMTKATTDRVDSQAHYDRPGSATDDEWEHYNLCDEPSGLGPAATKQKGLDSGAGLPVERGPDDMMTTKVGGAPGPEELST
jgi:hypothetical protein